MVIYEQLAEEKRFTIDILRDGLPETREYLVE